MVLKSITVGNYKNIGLTTIELNRVVSFVSPNNYGKSNLLDAIEFGFSFINESPKARNNMMKAQRLIPLTHKLANEPFVFSLVFEEPELGDYQYVKYGFSFEWLKDNNQGAVIIDETLEIRATESVRYTGYLKRSEEKYRSTKNTQSFRKLKLASNVLAIDILQGIDSLDIGSVINCIKRLSFNEFKELELRQLYQPSFIEMNSSHSDNPIDAVDIPTALFKLKEKHPEDYELFVESVYDLYPEFDSVEVTPYVLNQEEHAFIKQLEGVVEKREDVPYHVRDDLFRLTIKSSYFNQPLSIEYMSTGTQRMLWLLANAVFCRCFDINLLGIDEVEASIHPKMMKALLEALDNILENSSVLLTSHSPYLIQYLKPESIYIGVPNNEGIAQFKRIHPSKVKKLIQNARSLDISIGEYIFELMSSDEDASIILNSYLED